MTDDGSCCIVHLAVGVRCTVVVTDVQASVNVVDIANNRVGVLPVVVRVQRRAVGRTVGAPETLNAVGIAEVLRATHIQHVTYHDIDG